MNTNRRFFLLGSAAAASMYAQSSDKVRTAVIGTGGRGSYLLKGILEQPDASVTALCDIKPDRVDKAATSSARDNPKTYSDWHQIIERKDIDAVFIATPPHLHSEMAIAALKSGKNVYCEKPVGVTPAQVRALVEVARSAKTVFTAGQQMRSNALYQQAIGKIRDGVIGEVIMVKAQRHATADLAHDGTSGDWYFDVTKSGGYLIEQSVHNLDLCNWAIGSHPLKAAGFGAIMMYKNDPPGRSIFDCGSITYQYTGGLEMAFTQNVFHPRGMPNGNQYVYIYGTKGAIDLIGTPTMYPLAKDAQPVPLVEKQPENQYAHIVRFYECVRKGGPNPADITIGASAALTAILGHEAMMKQSVVNWSDMGVKL